MRDIEHTEPGEESPLLEQATAIETTSSKPKILSWNGEDDPENPRNLPTPVKARIGFIITSIAILS
jgi:hypothetical protein